jgi:hypothetical protein
MGLFRDPHLMSGISIRSQAWQAICGLSDTSVPQCWREAAKTSRFDVGLGCRGRCAPACGLPFGLLLVVSREALRPWLGGVEELSGVFGGKPCLASNAATRTQSSSTRARSATINASLSDGSSERKLGGEVIHSLTHMRSRHASEVDPGFGTIR